jgi:hypothetical protein
MKTSDFTTTLLVDQTPKEVFDAINHVRGWWSENIEGDTDKIYSEFYYSYQDVHRCQMKIIEFIPDKKVSWLIIDNYFNFTTDKSEWIGTTVHFEIAKKDDKTQIIFTHQGLVPAYECYEICEQAWTRYLQQSLRSLIATGKGQPNAEETKKPRAEKIKAESH